MAVYADHPFPLIQTPSAAKRNGSNPEEPDLFDALASDMALAHNMVIRSLNSIYLQAPHIARAEEKDFCRYMLTWYNFLHIHHTREETVFFPAVEEMAGEKGIMDVNVQQHRAFGEGLAAFSEYVGGVLAGKDSYDGTKVVGIIDSFGAVLVQHLTDEIGTLAGLRRFGSTKMGTVMRIAEREADRTMGQMGLAGVAWAWANIDTQFEDGMWAGWPPAPAPAKFLIATILWRLYRSLSKFGACDKNGRMKPLYAIPKSGS